MRNRSPASAFKDGQTQRAAVGGGRDAGASPVTRTTMREQVRIS